jgi:hypothetical protein
VDKELAFQATATKLSGSLEMILAASSTRAAIIDMGAEGEKAAPEVEKGDKGTKDKKGSQKKSDKGPAKKKGSTGKVDKSNGKANGKANSKKGGAPNGVGKAMNGGGANGAKAGGKKQKGANGATNGNGVDSRKTKRAKPSSS